MAASYLCYAYERLMPSPWQILLLVTVGFAKIHQNRDWWEKNQNNVAPSLPYLTTVHIHIYVNVNVQYVQYLYVYMCVCVCALAYVCVHVTTVCLFKDKDRRSI